MLLCGVELASLEHPVSQVRLGSGGRFSDLEGERQSCVERLDHPGCHLRSGVPIAGADAAAPLQLPAATALVAHQLIDHPRRDPLVLQPGREAVPEIVGSAELQELGRAYEELGGRKQQGAYGEALIAYTAALELVDAETDPGFYGTLLQDIGDVHTADGRLRDAVVAYERAVEHLRGAADASKRLPTVLISLGRVRQQLGTLGQETLANGEAELPPGSAPD
jgi:tetratricopeptide (TPR) repeat protein